MYILQYNKIKTYRKINTRKRQGRGGGGKQGREIYYIYTPISTHGK